MKFSIRAAVILAALSVPFFVGAQEVMPSVECEGYQEVMSDVDPSLYTVTDQDEYDLCTSGVDKKRKEDRTSGETALLHFCNLKYTNDGKYGFLIFNMMSNDELTIAQLEAEEITVNDVCVAMKAAKEANPAE